MLRTLIIDDNLQFLESLSDLLSCYPGVVVVGVASGGVQGLQAAADLAPDLVLVDLKMPGIGGMEVAARLLRQQQTRVVIISLHDDPAYRARALALGAERFICKQDLFDELPSIVAGAASSSPAPGAAK